MSAGIQISDAEFQVMKIIWENYPINTNEIINKLKKTSSWSSRTIQTMISRLEKKKAISHEKDGRIFVYSPLIEEKAYIGAETDNFINKFYNGAFNKMILNFINSDKLTEDDIKELKNILSKRQ